LLAQHLYLLVPATWFHVPDSDECIHSLGHHSLSSSSFEVTRIGAGYPTTFWNPRCPWPIGGFAVVGCAFRACFSSCAANAVYVLGEVRAVGWLGRWWRAVGLRGIVVPLGIRVTYRGRDHADTNTPR
jgi:hypothetical protein